MLGKLSGVVRAPFLLLAPAVLAPVFAVLRHATGSREALVPVQAVNLAVPVLLALGLL